MENEEKVETREKIHEAAQQIKEEVRSAREEYRFRHPHEHHGDFLFAVILLFIGVIFLLNNFGVLPWEVWNSLWRLWPILLILWALKIIFGRGPLGGFVINILGLIVTAFLVAYIISNYVPQFDNYLRSKIPYWENLRYQPFCQSCQKVNLQNIFDGSGSPTKTF